MVDKPEMTDHSGKFLICITFMWVAFSIAVGVACFFTKNGWPLFAFILAPRYSLTYGDSKDEK